MIPSNPRDRRLDRPSPAHEQPNLVDVKIPRPARVPSFDNLYRQERYEPERDPFAEDVAEREEER